MVSPWAELEVTCLNIKWIILDFDFAWASKLCWSCPWYFTSVVYLSIGVCHEVPSHHIRVHTVENNNKLVLWFHQKSCYVKVAIYVEFVHAWSQYVSAHFPDFSETFNSLRLEWGIVTIKEMLEEIPVSNYQPQRIVLGQKKTLTKLGANSSGSILVDWDSDLCIH